MLVVLVAVFVALVDRGSCSAKWGYSGEFGPYNWPNVDTSPNDNQCGRKHQSPVDLDERYAEFDPALNEITFSGYDRELESPSIVNNGHTVQVSASEDPNRYIEGANLPGRFQFAQFHFHWGANSSRGSEHTIRGFQYPLELHLVHFNAKYGSASEAMKYQDGLAVVAIYFEVSPTPNEDLSGIVDALKNVRLSDHKGTSLQQPVVLSRFLPRMTRQYFRYPGSLTTPPCSEAVTFTVMTTTVPISEEQLQQFRLLRTGSDESSSLLVDNFRPTFPLNGRRVFKSFPSSATRLGLGPEGFPSLQSPDQDSYEILTDSGFDDRFKNRNRKPSGDRQGNRHNHGRPQTSSGPRGNSRPGGSSRPRDSSLPGRDFPRNDGPSRPRDFPRDYDGPRDFPRNDGPSRSRGDSSRPRDSSRPQGPHRHQGSSGRGPQQDSPRRRGNSDEEGFPSRREFSQGSPSIPPRGSGGPEEFPHLRSVPGPQDFAPSVRDQGPRGFSRDQDIGRPEQFPGPQLSPNPQQFPNSQQFPGPEQFPGPQQFSGPRQFSGPQQQPFPRPQGFSGGFQEAPFPQQGSRSQENPRGPGGGLRGVVDPARG
ncbi:uncharacterized protein LOC144121096 isoform X1 [Amblyomma americanum]